MLRVVKEKLDGKELILGLCVFAIAWMLLVICVCPIPWYNSITSVPCESNASIDVKKVFTVTLWRYHSCSQDPLDCTSVCENKSWNEVWKLGCGGIGPQGDTVYCYDFDVSGEMTASFLILGICISAFIFPLSIIRKFNIKIKFVTPLRIGKVCLTLLAFCWSCMLMSWIWYPYIADASVWEDQNDGNIHLSYGWYILMVDIVIFFFAIIIFIFDYTHLSNRLDYDNLNDDITDNNTTF
mmetsp:Transcript_20086/g.34192  ORF Transcript_20086/g.34192 Transcript_20086/m.34192 type:complete len:239 (+) Transcript_20086:15-731(+)